jgi:hypothetical protein
VEYQDQAHIRSVEPIGHPSHRLKTVAIKEAGLKSGKHHYNRLPKTQTATTSTRRLLDLIGALH